MPAFELLQENLYLGLWPESGKSSGKISNFWEEIFLKKILVNHFLEINLGKTEFHHRSSEKESSGIAGACAHTQTPF